MCLDLWRACQMGHGEALRDVLLHWLFSQTPCRLVFQGMPETGVACFIKAAYTQAGSWLYAVPPCLPRSGTGLAKPVLSVLLFHIADQSDSIQALE